MDNRDFRAVDNLDAVTIGHNSSSACGEKLFFVEL